MTVIVEARRIVSKHENGNRKAIVYKDPEWNEHQVEFHENGVHLKDATSYDNGDKEGKKSSQDTANHWVNQTKKQNESSALAESISKRILSKLTHFADEHIHLVELTAFAANAAMHAGVTGAITHTPSMIHIVHQSTKKVVNSYPLTDSQHAVERIKAMSPARQAQHKIQVGKQDEAGYIRESTEEELVIESELYAESSLKEAWSQGARHIAGAAVLALPIAFGVNKLDKPPTPAPEKVTSAQVRKVFMTKLKTPTSAPTISSTNK